MKVQLEASTPLGYVQDTTLSAAGVIPNVPTGVTYAVIQAEGQDVRWRDDNVDPTTAVGMVLKKDAEMVYDGDFTKLKFIEVTAGAKLNVAFYGRKNAL